METKRLLKIEDVTIETIKEYIAEIDYLCLDDDDDIGEINEIIDDSYELKNYQLKYCIENSENVSFYDRDFDYSVSDLEIYNAIHSIPENAIVHCHPDTRTRDRKRLVEVWYSDDDHCTL